jgi:hypothetical protein
MKKIFLAALALTMISGFSYASEGGKKKAKKAKTECTKKCAEQCVNHCTCAGSCCDKGKAA